MKTNLIILSLLLINFYSCKKTTDFEGCTDLTAENYNSIANKDDGICTYQSSATFWWKDATREWMYDNADVIKIYVNDEVFASSEVSFTSWTSVPNCESNGSLRYTLDLGSAKTATQTYKVLSDEGTQLWAGSIDFVAGECLSVELVN
jgi:hypothetical protein